MIRLILLLTSIGFIVVAGVYLVTARDPFQPMMYAFMLMILYQIDSILDILRSTPSEKV